MSIRILCPQCNSEIPISDVQPAADLAICRACNQTHSLSAITAGAELDDTDLDAPPRAVTVINEADGLRIRYKRISGAFWFLLPFTCVWSGFSIGGIYIKPILDGKTQSVSHLLHGLPFLIGTLVMLDVLIYMALEHRLIRIRPSGFGRGEITVFNGVGRLGRTQRIDYDRETTVTMEPGGVSINHVPQDDICLRTESEELRFGAMLVLPARQYIAALIRETIRTT